MENLFENNEGEICAVILEPFVGNAGFIPPKPEFLNALRKITKENNALLIFDEVMARFRLCGAQEYFGTTPDLTTLGKIIGGGLPVGAYGGRREIVEMVAPAGPVYQAGTLSGNPLAMTAGIHTLKPHWIRSPVNLFKALLMLARKLSMQFVVDIYVECLGFSSRRGLFTTSLMQRKVTQQSLPDFFKECWGKVYALHLHNSKRGLQAWHILMKIFKRQ